MRHGDRDRMRKTMHQSTVDFCTLRIVDTADRSSVRPTIAISTPGDSLIQVLMSTRPGEMQTQAGRGSSSRSAAVTAVTGTSSASTAAHLQSNPADKYDGNGKVHTPLLRLPVDLSDNKCTTGQAVQYRIEIVDTG